MAVRHDRRSMRVDAAEALIDSSCPSTTTATRDMRGRMDPDARDQSAAAWSAQCV